MNGLSRLIRIVTASLPFLLISSFVADASAQRGRPYTEMNYGPTLAMTLELSPDNLAHKGIAVRLDDGPGGVSQGTSFAAFDTDTLRYAGAWHGGQFIDWHGIIFDGGHGAHPKIGGDLIARHGMSPGWRGPDGTFVDPRIRGVDGRAYGPLPRSWGRWNGMYLRRRQVVMSYSILGTEILDSPSIAGDEARPAVVRTLEIAPHVEPLVMSVADAPDSTPRAIDRRSLELTDEFSAKNSVAILPVVPPQRAGQLDLASDFTISAWIKTQSTTGTIFSKAAVDGPWVPRGKTFFVRNGRLGFDVGWVGVVQSETKIDDGQWHHVAVTHRARNGQTRLLIDGEADGAKRLKSPDGDGHIVRLGYTASDFMPPFDGMIDDVRFYDRTLDARTLGRVATGQSAEGLVAHWDLNEAEGVACRNATSPSYSGAISGAKWVTGKSGSALQFDGKSQVRVAGKQTNAVAADPSWRGGFVYVATLADSLPGARWILDEEHIRLLIPPADRVQTFRVVTGSVEGADVGHWLEPLNTLPEIEPLEPMTHGGPRRWLAKIPTTVSLGADDGPFAVDVITLPNENPWRSWMRLGGFDYFADNSRAAVCTWQGDVWLVDGLGPNMHDLKWQRIATGLFQPLGLKVVNERIYVLGRDQITRLHDLNGDGETDYYENFNNDAQVTEHFHEFAMDLQTDAAGNFYYTKGARHALPAVVPQHGTLIRVSPDGQRSEIIAKGFRAPNGLHVNDDGSFFSSDQEGHWTPMNRINLIRPGGFYGNMMAYVPEKTDTNHDPPLCWIHKGVDRSPSEQLRIEGSAWSELEGGLLSLSYGTGKIWHVLHERIGTIDQGGITRLPLGELPTGIHRARFHPRDGQLYAAGLFGWSSNQTQPGGFFRIRRTGAPLHLATELRATRSGMLITFTKPLADSAAEPGRYRVERWNYRRSANYGSDDYRVVDGRPGRDTVPVSEVVLSRDRRSVFLVLPDMAPVMQMEMQLNLTAVDGTTISQVIHHTIHRLGETSVHADRFDRPIGHLADARPENAQRDHPGLLLRLGAGRDSPALEDMRVSRLLALRVESDEPASPFLPAGPFTAVWEGQLLVDLTDQYQFSAETAGELVLSLDGREILRSDPSATGIHVVESSPIELAAGTHAIRAKYVSPPATDGMVRVSWKSQRFPVELIPPWSLRHDPARSGVAAFHMRRQGRALFADLACVRCHRSDSADQPGIMPELARDAPQLGQVAGRLTPEWIAAWIRDPAVFREHARMPRMLSVENDADVAAQIARFLTERPAESLPPQPALGPESHRAGERLYEELGCMACHTLSLPDDDDPFDRTSLHYVGAKYQPGALAEFLRSPHERYSWSSMPDFRLTTDEAQQLARYLRREAAGRLSVNPRLAQADASAGKRAFTTHGCAQCHPLENVTPAVLELDSDRLFLRERSAGCLADQSVRQTGQPHYNLTDGQRRSIQSFLQSAQADSLRRRSSIEFAERTIVTMNCQACHDRDGVRSPRREIIAEEGGGLAPELLPPLTWTGDKLKRAWLTSLLAGEELGRTRPWLKARMPRFPAHAKHLAVGLTGQHGRGPAAALADHYDPELAEIGRRLAQPEGGLNCVQCHNVGDREATAPFDNRGVNFSYVANRIQVDYYTKWMLDPLRLEPQTKMPQFAANGLTTSVTSVYEGNARQQFEALWHYLREVGSSAHAETENPRGKIP